MGLGVDVFVRLQFCGHEAGPRTIFTIDATCAYDIAAFSFYGEEEAEVRAKRRPCPNYIWPLLTGTKPIFRALNNLPPDG